MSRNSAVPPARAIRLGRGPQRDAPRHVPLAIRAALRLGGVDVQLSWLLAVVGMIACLVVIPRIGVARDTAGTTAPAAEVARPGKPLLLVPPVERAVTVEYRPGGRKTVRYYTRDGSSEVVGRGALALLAWPAAAGLLAAVLMLLRRDQLRLLRFGTLAEGQLVRRTIAGDDSGAFLTFVHTAGGAARTVEVGAPRSRTVTEDAPVALLHEASDPELAVALADLPGHPAVASDRVTATRSVGLAVFALPGLALAGAITLLALSVG